MNMFNLRIYNLTYGSTMIHIYSGWRLDNDGFSTIISEVGDRYSLGVF